MPTMPTWFLAHGAPSHLLDQRVRGLWTRLPATLPRAPRALLAISAHWRHPRPAVSRARELQYDFYGFPKSLYRQRWPLPRPDDDPTAQALIRRLHALLEPLEETDRPLDHGVWVPLKAAWPRPPFPVLQLSLPASDDPHVHWELGRQLAPLRREGVLLVASGGLVHNLARLRLDAPPTPVEPWAEAFMNALEAALMSGRTAALHHPHRLPHGALAVPTWEHYLPLLVALGAAHGEPVRPLLRAWDFGHLALHSYACGV